MSNEKELDIQCVIRRINNLTIAERNQLMAGYFSNLAGADDKEIKLIAYLDKERNEVYQKERRISLAKAELAANLKVLTIVYGA